MEDALRGGAGTATTLLQGAVLILVLMEDALRGFGLFTFTDDGKRVLILVLMEDALRESDHPYNAVMDYVS